MIPLKQVLASTVGRKYIMSLTGLALVVFIIAHLLGNLQLLLPSGDKFNQYTHAFHELGPLLYLIEIGLLAVILIHAVVAFVVTRTSWDARPENYAVEVTKGGESKSNLSSKYMWPIGLVLLAFMFIHVLQFRFGVFSDQDYRATVEGVEMLDLHRLVVETFQNPLWVFFYVAVMVLLGFHLRHGIWSMFQSVGAMPAVYSNTIYAVGSVVAALIALGFLILPIYLYVAF